MGNWNNPERVHDLYREYVAINGVMPMPEDSDGAKLWSKGFDRYVRERSGISRWFKWLWDRMVWW